MSGFVKGSGEIKQGGTYLCLVIYSCYPVMNCVDEIYTRATNVSKILVRNYVLVWRKLATGE